jgi:hypothetical protein
MVRDRSDGADPTTVIRSPRSAVSAAGGFSRGSASDSRDVRRYDAGEHTERGEGPTTDGPDEPVIYPYFHTP